MNFPYKLRSKKFRKNITEINKIKSKLKGDPGGGIHKSYWIMSYGAVLEIQK